MSYLDAILQKIKLRTNTAQTEQQNSGTTAKSELNPSLEYAVKNWHEERYDRIVVQRNLLSILLGIFLALSVISIMAITIVINAKQFDPFVIQVDETTGRASIVNPTSTEILSSDESMARYFIKKYVIARETYNPVDFTTQARQIIRLLSTSGIFWNYLSSLKNQGMDPSVMYGQKNTTSLVVKSWSKLDKQRYMLRFLIKESEGERRSFHRLAIIDFNYVAMDLTEAERDINPLGFQVQGYRVDDDNS